MSNKRQGQVNLSETLKNYEGYKIPSCKITMSNSIINRGACAHVVKATYDNKDVAVKEFFMELWVQTQEDRDGLHNMILKEFLAMVEVSKKCNNILEILGFTRDHDKDNFRLVMPLMKKNLKEEIFNSVPKWDIKSEEYIKKQFQIILSIVYGLKVLHEHNIIHRDLKPANILIDFDGTIKLGDLGEAKALSVTNTYSKAGSPIYQSPEVKYRSIEKMSVQADIFSLGVIIIEMNILEEPKNYPNSAMIPGQTKILKEVEVRAGELNRMTDPFLRRIAEECIEENPELRPTAKQLYEFRF